MLQAAFINTLGSIICITRARHALDNSPSVITTDYSQLILSLLALLEPG
jgi:hypothetical protein